MPFAGLLLRQLLAARPAPPPAARGAPSGTRGSPSPTRTAAPDPPSGAAAHLEAAQLRQRRRQHQVAAAQPERRLHARREDALAVQIAHLDAVDRASSCRRQRPVGVSACCASSTNSCAHDSTPEKTAWSVGSSSSPRATRTAASDARRPLLAARRAGRHAHAPVRPQRRQHLLDQALAQHRPERPLQLGVGGLLALAAASARRTTRTAPRRPPGPPAANSASVGNADHSSLAFVAPRQELPQRPAAGGPPCPSAPGSARRRWPTLSPRPTPSSAFQHAADGLRARVVLFAATAASNARGLDQQRRRTPCPASARAAASSAAARRPSPAPGRARSARRSIASWPVEQQHRPRSR